MPTHPLGYGTRNLGCNLPNDLYRAIARLASMQNQSVSGLVRDMIKDTVANARISGVLTSAAQESLKLGFTIVATLGLAAVLNAAVLGNNDPRTVKTARKGKSRDEIAWSAEDDNDGGIA